MIIDEAHRGIPEEVVYTRRLLRPDMASSIGAAWARYEEWSKQMSAEQYDFYEAMYEADQRPNGDRYDRRSAGNMALCRFSAHSNPLPEVTKEMLNLFDGRLSLAGFWA